MAKPVSQAFKDAFEEKVGKEVILEVRYRRRFFDTNTQEFVYEEFPTILDQSELGEIGEIQWSLDFPFQNKFTSSNVSIFLNNTFNQWLPKLSSPSIFAADEVAPNGYAPELTEFKILWGYRLADGSVESVALFTGLADEFIFSGLGASVEIVVEGRERLMRGAEAAKVSNSFEDENLVPEPGDTTDTRWNTTSTGVGRVRDEGVKIAGLVQVQGQDYEVENLNLFEKPALIIFTSAPPALATKTASGIKWLVNQKIEDLVGLLMDEAGIPPSERTIEPVTFPAGVGGRRTYDTQADWEAGIVDATLDTVTEPGSVILQSMGLFDDFSDGDFLTPIRTWTSPFLGAWTAATNRLCNAGTFQNIITTPNSQQGGTWEIKMEYNPGAVSMIWYFYSTTNDPHSSGVGWTLGIGNSVVGQAVLLQRRVGFGAVTLGSAGINTPSGEKTYRVTLDKSTGTFNVFIDGILSIIAVDPSIIPLSNVATVCWRAGASPGVNVCFDDLRQSTKILTGLNESEVTGQLITDPHDTGAGNPTAWGTLDRFETLDGDSAITYETATSDDNITYDAFVPLGIAGFILSTVRRFIKVRATFIRSTDGLGTPHLERLVVNFTVGTVVVSLANHEGKTVYEMIEIYARIPDYVFGADNNGDGFYNSKLSNPTPVAKITQENGIIDIEEYRLGLEDVRTVGQVQYGNYFSEFDGEAAGESPPTPEQRFGRKIQFEDLGNILLANDVNLAKARARTIYDRRKLPLPPLVVKAKMIPHADPLDLLTLDFLDNPLLEDVIFGDPLQEWGGDTTAFGGAENVLAKDTNFTIVAIKYNPEEISCDLNLRGVPVT